MELESSRECSMDAQEAAESHPQQQGQGAASALLQQDVATFLQEFNLFAEELQERIGVLLCLPSRQRAVNEGKTEDRETPHS